MLDAQSIDVLTRSLILGTARQSAPVAQAFGGLIDPADPKATLKGLALLGQRSRFIRPPAAQALVFQSLFADERAVVAAAARPLFLALFSGKGGNSTDSLGLAVADAMARKHLKLHPFDLPRLDDFVRAHSDRLGASAAAWAERNANEKSTDPQGYSYLDTLDVTNWMHGRPAQKTAFISALRAKEPGLARELLAGAFPSEQAPVRVGLVKALAERLSPADAPFLEGLANDRAPSVREAAESLLARLPGSPLAAKRLKDCLSRIKAQKRGVLRQRTVLTIDYPATLQDWQRLSWALATFGALGLGDFAQGLGLSVDELVEPAADDPNLATILALQASQEGRFDLLARLVRNGAANAWTSILQVDDFRVSEPSVAAAWSASAIQPDLWQEMPQAAAFVRLYERLRMPLLERVVTCLFASTAWQAFAGLCAQQPPPVAADTVGAIAALTPATQRSQLREEVAAFEPSVTARAISAMSLLDHIEAG
ncbi:MAG: hypothetical protein JO273_21340 [Methylobacteriaceae bacterium]|nr:hypothetical protein [Methylobacteriaceae bacterium]